ncbi:MAG TPA: CDGSH iron-sulfur domain-containing protein [Alphaproteobacteria bacterium]|nr:CDGSH iron-sulfur domain-containing protein [Alphaproteobacteria bacterium]
MSQPNCPQPTPCEVNLEEGKTYYWCTCGLSQKHPFCDGAHKGSGLKSHCFTAEATGKKWLCGCKQSKTPPFCDSSHLKVNS